MGDWFQTFDEFAHVRALDIARLARSILHDSDQASDVAQEVLARVYLHWNRVRAADNPEFYVKRIIVNECNSWRRRRSKDATPIDPADLPERSAPDFSSDVDNWAQSLHLLRGLPIQQRTVLALRFLDQLSDEEIASVMGISEATVRSHSSKGMATLRAVMRTAGGE